MILQAPLLGDSHRDRRVPFKFWALVADTSSVCFTAALSLFEPSLIFNPRRIAHELSRLVFRFKRDGFLETIGPAGKK